MYLHEFHNGCTSRILVALLVCAGVTACSNGGSGSDQRVENTLPTLQLSDGDVLSNGNSVVRIPATDDTGIANVTATLLRQGPLEECRSQLDFSLVSNSLLEACLADQPTCAVEFIPTASEVVVYPPPLYAPIGLEYELSLIDRDGSATDPARAVFCFDVGANSAPIPAADTYQLIYPSVIQKNGVSYDERCEKQGGADGVLANDDDDEHITNSCLSAELIELPRFASNLSTFRQSFRSNGGFRYEALADAPGAASDSFTYRVTDGINAPSAPITVEIIFSGENSPPVAASDSFELAEDSQSQALNVLDNDVDPDALPLTITAIFNGPVNGNASIRNGVVIDYVPNANFSGQDQFSYTAIDSGGLSTTASVTINITGVNDQPNAQNDSASTDENVPVEINVLANDSDPEGNALSVSGVATPINGTAVLNSSGTITYTPNQNFSGSDSFEYTITDEGGATDTATAVVTIRFINVAPVANTDNVSVEEGGVVTVDVVANDTDQDGDSLVVSEVTQPTNGVAEIVSDSVVRYTPGGNFNGSDSFTYRLSDSVASAFGQVNITIVAINDLPVAANDTASTAENTPVTINVVANDTDPDGDSLTVDTTTAASSGTVVVSDDGKSVLYSPAGGFSGTDTFNYTVVDGNGGSATAIVTVQVTNTNVAPVANADTATTPQDTATTIDVLQNDSDPDGDPITISSATGAANGTTVIQNGAIVYTPANGFDGTDSFSYQIADDAGLTATAQVSVTVTDVNQTPVAVNDVAGTAENTAITVDVLLNDTDADGDSLTVSRAGSAANGSTAIADNKITYTPANDFSGQDQFTYQISDGRGGIASGTVVVTVSNVNRPPLAVNDAVSNEQDDDISIDVLTNDSDPDGDTLTVQSVGQPANGAAVVSANGLRVVYGPDDGYFGVDRFTYTITDGNGATASATVTVTVVSTNVAPVANADTASTLQDSAVTINVTANDSDANGDTLVLDDVTAAANGTAVIVGANILYTPAAGFAGTDTFSYKINDGNGGEATAAVTVTVTEVITNEPPVAVDDTGSMPQDTTEIFNVLANDLDPEDDALSLTIASAATGVAIVIDDTVSYTPPAGFTGLAAIEYTIEDVNGGSDSATLTVEVTEVVNLPPLAVDDAGTMFLNTIATFDVLANDSDPEGDNLVLTVPVQPLDGVAIVVDSQIQYTPEADFTGIETIAYTVDDGNGGVATADLVVTVELDVVVSSI